MHHSKRISLTFCCFAALISLCFITPEAQAREHALTGKASWYGGFFHGRLTASGAIYDMYMPTAAHKTLPFGTVVEVTEQGTGLKTVVCITDRGPYIRGRIIDLSKTAGHEMDLSTRGVTPVSLRVVSDVAGTLLDDEEAFFVHVADAGAAAATTSVETKSTKPEKFGPYDNFGDACVLHEIIRAEYPAARITLEKRPQEEAPVQVGAR